MSHSKESIIYDIKKTFATHFGSLESAIFSPGRANIIGEHTDYNQGFVLPFALEEGICFCGSKNNQANIQILAFDQDQLVEIPKNRHEYQQKYGWEWYFIHVIEVLAHRLPIEMGVNVVFGGNLPIGAGISSSSALTCGFIALLNDLYELNLSNFEMVKLASQAEIGFGVNGGMMDQFTIVFGKENQAILLDCRDNTYEYLPLQLKNEYQFYLINTNVKHNLINTEYNDRPLECKNAVEKIREEYKAITSLRDISYSDLPNIESILKPQLFSRVKFVIEENQRVLDTKQALISNNYDDIGPLLYRSHYGLSTLYQVSCEELDWLVEASKNSDNIIGARMMGGGFGGCTINLVKGSLSTAWINEMQSSYEAKFGKLPSIISIRSSDGISKMNV